MNRLTTFAFAALLALPAQGQSIPAVGTPATLDVATWNIEWFGSTSNGPSDERLQLDNVEAIIEHADIDLWAIQEIADEGQFDALLERIRPRYDGVLGRNGRFQLLGFIYDASTVQPRRITDGWLDQFRDAFAQRPPLLMEAEVVFPDTSLRLNFVSLHMKCCDDGYEQRDEASKALKNRIDGLLPNSPLIILGDFNDEFTASITGGKPSPYMNFLGDTDNYQFVSKPLDDRGEATWCSNRDCSSGSTFDHILITDELFGAYVTNTANRFQALVSAVQGYRDTTSDHLPVFARFSFPSETAAEMLPDGAFAITSLYPNPVRSTATLEYVIPAPGPVRIEIYDLLGRRISLVESEFKTRGRHRLNLDAGDLPTETYFVTLRWGDRRLARPIISVR